jgi:hypothetical protein
MASYQAAMLTSKKGLTVLLACAENQIDYHTYNSYTLKHLPKQGRGSTRVKVTNLCRECEIVGVQSHFPIGISQNLNDAKVTA